MRSVLGGPWHHISMYAVKVYRSRVTRNTHNINIGLRLGRKPVQKVEKACRG